MPAATMPVDQVLPDGPSVPDQLQLGRCRSQAHDIGVAWPAGVATLGEMACPLCGRPLTMTTRQLRCPFHVVGRAAASAQARRVRAAARAAVQANLAAGRSELARTLRAGDVLHPDVTRRRHPVRVVEAGLPGRHKSHVGLLVQTPLEALRARGRDDREDEQGRYLLSLPARQEVRLAGDAARGSTWPTSATEVTVAVARRELEHAERMLAHAKQRLADNPDPNGGDGASPVDAWTNRVREVLAELDAALAALDRQPAPPASTVPEGIKE